MEHGQGFARDGLAATNVARPTKIELDMVSRSFGTRKGEVIALKEVTASVAEGEFVCVVGPSGCGKSTLLRILAGLSAPSSGCVDIYVDDDGKTTSPLGVVFQDYGIFPWKTVLANVRFGLELGRVQRSEANERARHWLGKLGLEGFENAYPATLSGGMRQRVSIARALAVEPEILLLDEPFAALDPQLRLLLQEELLAVWENDRRTVVFITHSLEEAAFLGDRVLVMSARPGRIIADRQVPFARKRDPHLRGTPEFAAFEQSLWDLLRGELEQPAPAGAR